MDVVDLAYLGPAAVPALHMLCAEVACAYVMHVSDEACNLFCFYIGQIGPNQGGHLATAPPCSEALNAPPQQS